MRVRSGTRSGSARLSLSGEFQIYPGQLRAGLAFRVMQIEQAKVFAQYDLCAHETIPDKTISITPLNPVKEFVGTMPRTMPAVYGRHARI